MKSNGEGLHPRPGPPGPCLPRRFRSRAAIADVSCRHSADGLRHCRHATLSCPLPARATAIVRRCRKRPRGQAVAGPGKRRRAAPLRRRHSADGPRHCRRATLSCRHIHPTNGHARHKTTAQKKKSDRRTTHGVERGGVPVEESGPRGGGGDGGEGQWNGVTEMHGESIMTMSLKCAAARASRWTRRGGQFGGRGATGRTRG